MAERDLSARVALALIINDREEILLSERQHTGYLDGWHDVPSGHFEPFDERGRVLDKSIRDTAVRETAEEVGLILVRNELQLVHIYENAGYGDEPFYTGYFFYARNWSGEPQHLEPHKLGPPAFYPVHDMPRVTPQIRDALAAAVEDSTDLPNWSYYAKDEINPAGIGVK